MKSILDPDFEYTPSVETDIRTTFERVWRELGHSQPVAHQFQRGLQPRLARMQR